MLAYKNNKGNYITLSISYHAKWRFVQRYNRVNKESISIDNMEEVDALINKLFENSTMVKNADHHLDKRRKKYGRDTIYFINYPFRFVVQNANIITIELFGKTVKMLNKKNVPRISATLTNQLSSPTKTVCDVRFRMSSPTNDHIIRGVGSYPIPKDFSKNYLDDDMKEFIKVHINNLKNRYPDEEFEAALFGVTDFLNIVDKSSIFLLQD